MKLTVRQCADGPTLVIDSDDVTALTIKKHKSIIHAHGLAYSASVGTAYDVLDAHGWFVMSPTGPNPHYTRK